jgi:hypothetical protein
MQEPRRTTGLCARVWPLIPALLSLGACEGLPEDLEGRSQPLTAASPDRATSCQNDPRVLLGLVSNDVCLGADLFFRETFAGNGRTCASCHPAENNFTIDKEFIDRRPARDPLFIAEQRPELSALERPALLREFGLILENVDGFSDLEHRFTMRSVQHILGMATSVKTNLGRPPTERTGWSADGAPGAGELRDFATGAVTQHLTRSLARVPGTDFRLPTEAELNQMAAFQSTVGRTNEIDLTQTHLEDAGAEAGRQLFLGTARCQFCHNNAGANQDGGNRNFTIDAERIRLPALDAQGIPRDGGFGQNPFDADGDGQPDSFGNGQFNTPTLIEAADTAPFFHSNAFATLEAAIDFYSSPTFINSPTGRFMASIGQTPVPLTPTEVASLSRFLRGINAALNSQMALHRLEAAQAIVQSFGESFRDVQVGLLRLAKREVDDAIRVLSGAADLNRWSQNRLRLARKFIDDAADCAPRAGRAAKIRLARDNIADANARLGSGMSFTIGAGTLMF